MSEQKTGEILIQGGFITEAQFKQAIEVQKQSPMLQIGQILCHLDFITKADLDNVLDYNGKRRKLGEILVSEGLLEKNKLNRALDIANQDKIPLGQALVRMHLLDEEQVAKAIAHQYDLPFISLQGIRIEPELGKFVNAQYAARNRLVPVKLECKTLTVAVAFPLPQTELDHLKASVRNPVNLVIATESQIILAQQKLFHREGTFSFDDDLSLSEDGDKQVERSRYVHDIITVDVERLAKLVLSTAIRHKASDIHIESGEHGLAIRYRIDGMLQTIDLGTAQPLVNLNARQIISKLKIMCDMDIAERRRPQDSSFKLKVEKGEALRTVDFRVSTVPTQYGENVVIRVLDKRSEAISLLSLGYNPLYTVELLAALEKPTGIFLVTGPTGSGKSSALYALLGYLNRPECKTLTIEDPIEYTIDGITQTEVNETIGNTFSRLLRAFLRQDPDNIMVGEIRDSETADIAVKAALTGHTVLSTLHTNDTTSTVIRLLDMGLEASLLSTTLRGVIAQRLVRRICKNCCSTHSPSEMARQEFGTITEELEKHLLRGDGCDACNYTGFSGRLPIAELWLPDREELLLITRKPDNRKLRSIAFARNRRITMLEDGLRLVKAGETTMEELIRVVPGEQFEEWRQRYKTA